MNIFVDGLRLTTGDWEAVQGIPNEKLPPLTPEQREAAGKLRIPEEEYSRSALAGQRATERLLQKTQRFARLQQGALKAKAPKATLQSVGLRIWEDRFDVSIEIDGAAVPLGVAEEIVDDLFERGSAEAEQRVSRILDLALETRVS